MHLVSKTSCTWYAAIFVQEACDAASCDVAREKWLHLEIERQRRRADAAAEECYFMEQEKEQLAKRVGQLEVSKMDAPYTWSSLLHLQCPNRLC